MTLMGIKRRVRSTGDGHRERKIDSCFLYMLLKLSYPDILHIVRSNSLWKSQYT